MLQSLVEIKQLTVWLWEVPLSNLLTNWRTCSIKSRNDLNFFSGHMHVFLFSSDSCFCMCARYSDTYFIGFKGFFFFLVVFLFCMQNSSTLWANNVRHLCKWNNGEFNQTIKIPNKNQTNIILSHITEVLYQWWLPYIEYL